MRDSSDVIATKDTHAIPVEQPRATHAIAQQLLTTGGGDALEGIPIRVPRSGAGTGEGGHDHRRPPEDGLILEAELDDGAGWDLERVLPHVQVQVLPATGWL